MAEGLFVAGTDTGVGKTVITAGLVAWLRDAGHDARAIKPVQTGYPEDDDAGYAAAVCEDQAAATCLDTFSAPLAPAVAAQQDGRNLEYTAILEGCREALDDAAPGIVEGVGGVRVPLAGESEVIDLIGDLDLPVLVVARSGLGTLNHTALTVEALERRGASVHAVICNQYTNSGLAEQTNPETLEAMTGVPVHTVGALPVETPARVEPRLRAALSARVFPATLRPQ